MEKYTYLYKASSQISSYIDILLDPETHLSFKQSDSSNSKWLVKIYILNVYPQLTEFKQIYGAEIIF